MTRVIETEATSVGAVMAMKAPNEIGIGIGRGRGDTDIEIGTTGMITETTDIDEGDPRGIGGMTRLRKNVRNVGDDEESEIGKIGIGMGGERGGRGGVRTILP